MISAKCLKPLLFWLVLGTPVLLELTSASRVCLSFNAFAFSSFAQAKSIRILTESTFLLEKVWSCVMRISLFVLPWFILCLSYIHSSFKTFRHRFFTHHFPLLYVLATLFALSMHSYDRILPSQCLCSFIFFLHCPHSYDHILDSFRDVSVRIVSLACACIPPFLGR